MSDAARPKRPRRPRGPKKAPAGEDGAERPPRAPRAPATPVPESQIGKTLFGRVCDVMNRGRERFGFIYITPTDGHVPAAEEGKSGLALYASLPRIYFNAEEWKEGAETKVRKNDLVTFTALKDPKDRPYASNVTLTAQGKTAAVARDAAFAEAQKNAPPKAPRAAAGGGEDRPKREPRERKERKPIDERTVTLKLTCEGFPGTKEIVACVGESLGKLKHTGVTAFGAEAALMVFYKGEPITKATLSTISDGETVHLGAPKA